MNNAKMWLVVKPTVGLPLFLGGVAIGSFAVHLAVLSKTTWYEDYLLGQPLGTGARTAALVGEDAADAQKVVVVMPDGSRATAVIQASAEAPRSITH